MKTLIAAAAMSLMAGAAFAGEGNGDPFPFQAPPISVSMTNYKQAAPKSQDPYPFAVSTMRQQGDQPMPSNGSEGAVQTANSAPPGSLNGVANTNLQSAPPTRLAQPAAIVPRTRG